ncbi:MAG: protein translocase subunit SecDF [Bacteroidales bacterium]|nr:protein translocase subunit SecDF [Bacteroidales bacterium]
MRNKGAIKFIAIALALVCVYQLSFTYVTKQVEKKAKAYAKGDSKKEFHFLDSISTETVYNFLWVRKYTYKECKEREINLGLDLKGGMEVTLEVSVVDLIKSLANNSTDPSFLKAIEMAQTMDASIDFITRFGDAFEKIAPNARLAAIFNTVELRDRISFNSTNKDVLTIIRKEADGAIKNSFNIISTRIDKFGVAQANIQQLQTSGRILVQLPGVKEPERVRKLLQGTANLEFWETYENSEIYPFLNAANAKIKELQDAENSLKEAEKSTLKTTTQESNSKKESTEKGEDLVKMLKEKEAKDTTSLAQNDIAKNFPLFSILRPNVDERTGQPHVSNLIGHSHSKDTAKVNEYLKLAQVKSLMPRDLKLLWGVKAIDKKETIFALWAIKVTNRNGKAPLDGGVITDARDEIADKKGASEVSMSMNAEGSRIWARLTGDNVGRCIAIVLDNYVYSSPTVNGEIKGGRSSISGSFTINEAKDLANVLKSGKLPAPAKIIQEEVVGPSLGKEAINAGLLSFLFAFIGVLLYMSLYYGRAGNVANVALITNVFFTFGVMASLGAVLTLPGIAGMVLTFAMAVDGNIIIYERMREETRAAKGDQLVIKDGFQHALSAIIDGHVTTILTAVVLYIFGSGPVQGFATTLIIGLLLSLFTSILISRLVFEWIQKHNWHISTGNKYTINAFTKVNINFIKLRKIAYVISIAVVTVGVISLFVRGMSKGIDFTGGRTYVVRFDQPVNTQDIRISLENVMDGDAPEVKTFGPETQVKITTKYLIKDNSTKTDSLVEQKLFAGVKSFFKTPISYNEFSAHENSNQIGKMSSQKVGPTVAKEMIYKAFMAVFFGLIIIFIYITIRFKNWQFGLGGVVSLFHDTMIIITAFTLFHGILPFSLEVDQSFIAAILTIIGYSIMDTVIIFDRIREYRTLHPKWSLGDNINAAINSTLGRTINTSGITFVVLLIIFIFGGEVLRGFIFALLIGVSIGTFSSVFVATPVAYDIIQWQERKKEKNALKK